MSQERSIGKATVSPRQIVASIGGRDFVIMSRLCKSLGFPQSIGVVLLRKHMRTLEQAKAVIHSSDTGYSSRCIVMPLGNVVPWLKKVKSAQIPNDVIRIDVISLQSGSISGIPRSIVNYLIGSDGKPVSGTTDEQADPGACVERHTDPADFCDAVVAREPPRSGILVKLARKIEMAEQRLQDARQSASMIGQDVARLKGEMAKALGVSAGPAISTVAEFCASRRININSVQAKAIGRAASKYCNARGIEIGTAPHPHWNTVNTYPVEAIEYAISQQGGAA